MIPFTPHTLSISRRVSGTDDDGIPYDNTTVQASGISGAVLPASRRRNETGQATVDAWIAYLPGDEDVRKGDVISWAGFGDSGTMTVTEDPKTYPDPFNAARHHIEAPGKLVP